MGNVGRRIGEGESSVEELSVGELTGNQSINGVLLMLVEEEGRSVVETDTGSMFRMRKSLVQRVWTSAI